MSENQDNKATAPAGESTTTSETSSDATTVASSSAAAPEPVVRDAKTKKKSERKKRPVPVPNVKPKMDPAEQLLLQEKLNAQNTNHYTHAEEEVSIVPEPSDSKETNVLKNSPVLHFSASEKAKYHIGQKSTKIFIEKCKETEFKLAERILTRTVELWNCNDVKFHVETGDLKTLQLDLSSDIHLHYNTAAQFGSIIWNGVENLHVTFGDKKEYDVKTGFTEMMEVYPDSNETDQFIMRIIDGEFKTERCIRLKNGFLSTEREALEWEKRNGRAKDLYVEKFLKEAGIHLNKDKNKVKQKPNARCNCGSGKKFKKCCMNKITLTGVQERNTGAVSSSSSSSSSAPSGPSAP